MIRQSTSVVQRLFMIIAGIVLLSVPTGAHAQSQAEILERLRSSGTSREAARAQLTKAGYSSTLLDSYFDIIEGKKSSATLPEPTTDMRKALGSFGLGAAATPNQAPDSKLPTQAAAEQASIDATEDMQVVVPVPEGEGPARVFGRRLFQRGSTQFQPLTSGPVDPTYRIGGGDNLQIILTGEVEAVYNLDVSREGTIVIPQVGQVVVNGLTVDAMRRVLTERFSRAYSGIEAGTTHFDVSVGRLHTNQVFLMGEVVAPGQYEISSVATVFHALYQAGGPAEHGTFRNIQVLRGGRVVQTVDLYDYLLYADSKRDIRLLQGDNVFVPLEGKMVTVKGNVRREGTYELAGNEGLGDVLRFAGGFKADAFMRRIQIERILPPSQRVQGKDRTVIDVPLADTASARVALADGDVINIFSVSENRKDHITIRGEVERPGTYAYRPGLTLGEAIRGADGLMPDAYHAAAHVLRQNPVDGSSDLQRVELKLDASGAVVSDVVLRDLDEIVIFGKTAMTTKGVVDVSGPVNKEGRYAFANGMTIKDLILAAGGTKPELLPTRAQISRLRLDGSRQLIKVDLNPDSIGIPQQNVELAGGDQVRLFSRDALLKGATVTIYGKVRNPAEFVWTEGMTLQDLLLMSGGFAAGAMEYQVEVARRSSPLQRTDTLGSVYKVALSTQPRPSEKEGEAMREPVGHVIDVMSAEGLKPGPSEYVLREGDRVFVRTLPGFEEIATVEVSGQVLFPGPYPMTTRNTTVVDAIKAAGGVTKQAYIPGFRLVRGNIPVAIDLERALEKPHGEQDIALRPGDQLIVPYFDPTVLVTGAVPFETRVMYRPGQGIDYYIRQAGGFGQNAAEDRVSVTHANGEREVLHRSLWLFTSSPSVHPGSTIAVPAKPVEEKHSVDWGKYLTGAVALASTIATIVITVDRLQN
jgi:polysaccharide biosynthesis/export protein